MHPHTKDNTIKNCDNCTITLTFYLCGNYATHSSAFCTNCDITDFGAYGKNDPKRRVYERSHPTVKLIEESLVCRECRIKQPSGSRPWLLPRCGACRVEHTVYQCGTVNTIRRSDCSKCLQGTCIPKCLVLEHNLFCARCGAYQCAKQKEYLLRLKASTGSSDRIHEEPPAGPLARDGGLPCQNVGECSFCDWGIDSHYLEPCSP